MSCLNRPGLRGGAFGIGARRFRARPQLVVDQRMHHTGQHIATLNVTFRSGQRLFGGDHIQIRNGDGVLNRELRDRFLGASVGGAGLGLERVNWAAGLQIVIPNLFDFSTLRARRTAAEARTRIENARHDEALLTIGADQRAANAMVDAARAIAQNTPVQLSAARQGESQARARYDAGLTGMVEVAEAQNLLAAAEYQDAAARIDIWRALLAKAAAEGSMQSFADLVRAAGAQ